MLVDMTVRELLDGFASSAPTPGGGSAAALAGATGASLLMMVASLPKTRTGSEGERASLAAASQSLASIRRQLIDAIDADAAAYDQVVAAYRLPKGSEDGARTAAIQRGLREATEVPLGVMRQCANALQEAQHVGSNGHSAAASDVGVAIALLRAGLEGARLNVEINLAGLADAAYVSGVRETAAALFRDA